MEAKGAIVIGGYVNGLGVVRGLASRGIPAAVITTQPYDLAQRSRGSVAHQPLSGLHDDPDVLAAALDRWSSRFAGWALLPTNDEALIALARHHEHLARTYRVVAPPLEVARRLVDKQELRAAAEAAGVDAPLCYGAAIPATADRPDLRFPVLVKPLVGYRFTARFGSKLFVAHDRVEIARCIARLRDAGLDGEVFDFVPGADDRIHVYCTWIDERGEPSAGVTIHKLRQSPPFFGVARVAERVPDIPLLRDATVAIARRLGLRGFAAAEFKLDPRDGRFRFIEINGRSVVYNALLRRVGLDAAGLAWSAHVARRPEMPRPEAWPGVWINLHADVLYAALFRRVDPVGLGAFLAPYRRPHLHAVWSASDPQPFVAQWTHTVRLGLAALRRGNATVLVPDRSRVANA